MNEIRELAFLLKAKHKAQDEVAAMIGVSQVSLSRWLTGDRPPARRFRPMIRKTIGRLKKMPDASMDGLIAERNLFRRLTKCMTADERAYLLNVDGDYRLYRERLVELAAKYAIPADGAPALDFSGGEKDGEK